MKPSIAVDITTRDKTAGGLKSSDSRVGAWAKKTDSAVKQSGLGRIGKQLEGLSKFKGLSLGFDSAGRSLTSISANAGGVSRTVGEMTTKIVGFGAAGDTALGGVAETAGLAAGALAGTLAVVVGLGAATYMMGDKWAKTGAEVDRTRKTIGMAAQDLQAARAAGERFGVTSDATTSSLDSLSTTLYDARYGANNLALGALTQLGIKLRKTKDGAVDVQQAYLDIADAVAKQKDPQAQRAVANVFGMGAMLPALRQGSAAIKSASADFLGSGAALTDADVARSTVVNRKTVTLKQDAGAVEKNLGMAALTPTEAIANTGIRAASALAHGQPTAAMTAITDSAQSLVRGGVEAGKRLVDGAVAAGRTIGEEFEKFVGRIEHQESRGRQFDKGGKPLTSSAGAIGAMQMLPKTAQAAAASAGIPWDPERFRNDKAYNQQLGSIELQRLLKKFDGDEVLAAAAYNAGEGVMSPGGYRDSKGRHQESWLKRFGDPRTGETTDEEFAAKIPYKETRDYVANTASTAKAHVEITLRNAPAGTVAKATGAPGVDVNVNVARSLDGPG